MVLKKFRKQKLSNNIKWLQTNVQINFDSDISLFYVNYKSSMFSCLIWFGEIVCLILVMVKIIQ